MALAHLIHPRIPFFAGIASYEMLGNRIIRQIRATHAFRQTETVRELSSILSSLPFKEYQLVAQYYLAWCQCRELEYDNDALDEVIEHSRTYKTKALISRAAFEFYKSNFSNALFFYLESLKTGPTISDYLLVAKAIAVIKSIEGFHSSAIRDMERLLPFIRHAEPLVYYDFLNSYAVELGVAGRKQEARNISRIVLKSPFAYAYPEWQETANGLRGSRKSFISINSSRYLPSNVFLMPTARHEEIATRPNEPARVLDLQKWKGKIVNGKNDDEQKAVEEMNTSDMLLRAMQVFSDRAIPEQKRREMMKAIERILATPIKPEPDKPKPDEHGA